MRKLFQAHQGMLRIIKDALSDLQTGSGVAANGRLPWSTILGQETRLQVAYWLSQKISCLQGRLSAPARGRWGAGTPLRQAAHGCRPLNRPHAVRSFPLPPCGLGRLRSCRSVPGLGERGQWRPSFRVDGWRWSQRSCAGGPPSIHYAACSVPSEDGAHG